MNKRIDRLTDEIRHMERRIANVAMSRPDHEKACAYLAELHAECWRARFDYARKEQVRAL